LDLAVEKTRFESNKPAQDETKKGKENKKKTQDDSDIEQDGEDDDEEEDDEEEEEEEDDEEEDDEEVGEDEEAEEGEEEAKEEEEDDNSHEDFTCTLFVRNISYEVGQSEFRSFFQKFGPVEYAKVRELLLRILPNILPIVSYE